MECSDDLRYPASRSGSTRSNGRSAASSAWATCSSARRTIGPPAQPERDFYIYFIQPFDKPKFSDNNLADEVFFRLKGRTRSSATCLLRGGAGSGVHRQRRREGHLPVQGQDSCAMSKWLQEKQMTAFEVTYQGKTKTLQDWSKGRVSARPGAPGPGRAHQLPRRGERRSGLVLGQRFADLAGIPHLLGAGHRANRKQLVGNALRALAGGTAPRMPIAIPRCAGDARWRPRRPAAPATRRKC